jgi:uncharacterized protein (TIGR02246 family)
MTAINTLFENYKNAVFHKDLQLFSSIYDDDVLVFDMWQQWDYVGLGAWKEMAKTWFASLGKDRDVVTFDNIQIQLSGDLAFASALVRYTAVSEKDEELRYLEERFTWVIRKKGQDWKVIHQHSSGPIDFNTMKVILKR